MRNRICLIPAFLGTLISFLPFDHHISFPSASLILSSCISYTNNLNPEKDRTLREVWRGISKSLAEYTRRLVLVLRLVVGPMIVSSDPQSRTNIWAKRILRRCAYIIPRHILQCGEVLEHAAFTTPACLLACHMTMQHDELVATRVVHLVYGLCASCYE